MTRVNCWYCGCRIALHSDDGQRCRGWQQMAPGAAESCICRLTPEEAAATAREAERGQED